MVGCLVAVHFCGCRRSTTFAGPRNGLSRAELQDKTGIEIPLLATDIRSRWVDSVPDDSLHVRFKLPRTELGKFAAAEGMPVLARVTPPWIELERGVDLPWFKPAPGGTFLSGRHQGRHLDVLVAVDQPQWVTVYIRRVH